MANPKRILFLADINSIHTERWVKSLIQRGYQIALFSLSQKQTSWADGLANFEYQCFGVNQDVVRSTSRFGKITYFSAGKSAKAYFDSVQPDLVHAHYASSYGTLARQIGFEHTVLSLWGSDVYEFPKRSPIHRRLFKKAVKFAKVVCSTSEDMAKEAANYVKRDYVITPFGVDTNRFKPAEIRNDVDFENGHVITIGTVKSLEEVYGIDRLIETYAAFTQKFDGPSQLFIYGDGSQRKNLEEKVRASNLQDEVMFFGRVEGDALIAAFQSLDVFVALSRRESFGVAVLEAQACGIPCMVTNVGGLPEVIDPTSGMIVEQSTQDEWASNLADLIRKSRSAEAGISARSFVEQNFSDAVCVDKLIEVYAHV